MLGLFFARPPSAGKVCVLKVAIELLFALVKINFGAKKEHLSQPVLPNKAFNAKKLGYILKLVLSHNEI